MKTTVKILLIAAIAWVAISCDEPEAGLRNARTIDFTFESEAIGIDENLCANGSITVELLGETVKDNVAIGSFDFNCNSTGKVTVNVPVDSFIQITFNTAIHVDEFLTTVGRHYTYSEGPVVLKVVEE